MRAESYQRISRNLDFRPSEARLALHLVVDALLLYAVLRTERTPYFLVGEILLPVFMFRMFALMHDCLHFAATKRRYLSDAIGIVAGACCLLPYEPWKKIHLAHHKWTGNVDKDPSMGLIKRFPQMSERKRRLFNFCWRSWIPGLATAQHVVFWTKSYQFVLAAEGRPERIRNALSVAAPLVLYTQVAWSQHLIALALYLVMVEVVNFPHHLQMPMIRGEASFKARDQYRTARSCVYPRFFSRHLFNNFNLHIEHHLFPSLPWYRLEDARALVLPELGGDYTQVNKNAWIRENRRRPIAQILGTNYRDDLVATPAPSPKTETSEAA